VWGKPDVAKSHGLIEADGHNGRKLTSIVGDAQFDLRSEAASGEHGHGERCVKKIQAVRRAGRLGP
jgi:hypothetical protein